jgi:hypothetical protein
VRAIDADANDHAISGLRSCVVFHGRGLAQVLRNIHRDDSPHSLDQAKKIVTEWALKNVRMKSTFDFERGFPWHDIAEGWAIAFPKCADEE